jgi:hypothetical protein
MRRVNELIAPRETVEERRQILFGLAGAAMFLVHRAEGLRRHAYPGSPRETVSRSSKTIGGLCCGLPARLPQGVGHLKPDTKTVTIGFEPETVFSLFPP